MDCCRAQTHTHAHEDMGKQMCKQEVAQEVYTVVASVCDTYIDPGVIHKLSDGHSFIRVCLQ